MGGSRTTTRFGHLCSSTKKKQKVKTKKRYNLLLLNKKKTKSKNKKKIQPFAPQQKKTKSKKQKKDTTL